MKNRKFNPKQFIKAMTQIGGVALFLVIFAKVAVPVLTDAPISKDIAIGVVQYDSLTVKQDSEPVSVKVDGLKNPAFVVKMSDNSYRVAYMDDASETSPYHAREITRSEEDQQKYAHAIEKMSK